MLARRTNMRYPKHSSVPALPPVHDAESIVYSDDPAMLGRSPVQSPSPFPRRAFIRRWSSGGELRKLCGRSAPLRPGTAQTPSSHVMADRKCCAYGLVREQHALVRGHGDRTAKLLDSMLAREVL